MGNIKERNLIKKTMCVGGGVTDVPCLNYLSFQFRVSTATTGTIHCNYQAEDILYLTRVGSSLLGSFGLG